MNSGCHDVGIAHRTAPAFPDREEILVRLKKYPREPYFPPAADRKSWNGLPEELRRELIRGAEKSLKKPWPLLTAREYMLYGRTGDRRAYEDPYFAKRVKLIALVTGECCEYKGRFMDEIIEGLWQILSEPAWCLPAHEGLTSGETLPDPERFRIDLFNASTGKTLADVLELLEPELAKISPMLVRRVRTELMRRLIEPAEQQNDDNTWWFSGFNNWTPWCASNLSGCAVYLLDDQPERLAGFLDTYLEISRRFYEKYPADGGCGEGPAYWRHAAGKYLQHLDILDRRLRLGGRLFRDEKLLKMCEFPAGMNLCGRTFLSTSDSVKDVNLSAGFLNFAARKTASARLAALAGRMKRESLGRASELSNYLIDIFDGTAPRKKNGEGFLPVDFWPDLGLAVLREKSAFPEKGTVVSLKGGHNAESHNHNDLGHFTLMRNGKVLIADVGVGIYTAQTFGPGRYDIWNLGAQGHNQPRFSGVMQTHGAEYRAVLAMTGDDTVTADLAKAYPPAAGIGKLTREVRLDRRTGNVQVADTAEAAGNKKIGITLYTPVEPEKFSSGRLEWKQGTLLLENLKIAEVSEETRLDAKLKKTWGKLWKIELSGELRGSGRWKMNFNFPKKEGK